MRKGEERDRDRREVEAGLGQFALEWKDVLHTRCAGL